MGAKKRTVVVSSLPQLSSWRANSAFFCCTGLIFKVEIELFGAAEDMSPTNNIVIHLSTTTAIIGLKRIRYHHTPRFEALQKAVLLSSKKYGGPERKPGVSFLSGGPFSK